MIFKETNNNDLPIIILLHGGGLSSWALESVVKELKTKFHVVTPIIDGHGEDGHEQFVTISDSAQKLLTYIDEHCNGKVYAIAGLSIGAQIVIETLSIRYNVAEYAIIESALVYPIKGIVAMTKPLFKFSYGLIKKRWFAKMQAKELCISNDMFEKYYEDSIKMTKQSLINITISNGNYNLKSSIKNTKSKVLIIVGDKERKIMKKSAKRLNEEISGSRIYIAKNMKHGELSMRYPEKYIEIMNNLFE
jgi:pimeloyl-ACP methyl ester carboxylesterase